MEKSLHLFRYGAHAFEREHMVRHQLEDRGIRTQRVLDALRAVPRHIFVPEGSTHLAYEDRPLSIGHGQTISQPYIVGLMTEVAEVAAGDRVLEVGTGCGYQTAILALLAREVFTVEVVPALQAETRDRLERLGIENVRYRRGDGHDGWPEHAPYDAILVTAGALAVPDPLVEQLAPGGRLVIPVGTPDHMDLRRIRHIQHRYTTESLLPVRFVPLVRP